MDWYNPIPDSLSKNETETLDSFNKTPELSYNFTLIEFFEKTVLKYPLKSIK